MARSSYRKFLKQERAKIKLKNKEKKLLPKGQNVSDLNFKVKKIVIKTQLKDHQQDEPLSSRKLSLQDLLKRLGHYSSSASLEATNQLEDLLKSCSRSVLTSNLSAIVTAVSKLITSPHSHLRKAAIKLLSTILQQVEEREWLVLQDRVLGHIVCGLSHVEPGVRNDSLVALETLPSNLPLPPESILPSLLDLMSTSKPAGSRSLSTHISSSPTTLRTAVLKRVSTVLAFLHNNSSDSTGCKSKLPDAIPECKEIILNSEKTLRVPLVPSFPLHCEALSISEFTSSAAERSKSLDIKDFASSLIPLMLDSFAEIAPDIDEQEGVCQLNTDGIKLLAVIADVLLQLYDLLSSHNSNQGTWMKDKFGDQICKRLINGRFPYGEGIQQNQGRKDRGSQSSSSLQVSSARLNLTLALVAQLLSHQSSANLIPRFLAELLRNDKLSEEELPIFERCLLVCLQPPLSKPAANLLSSLTKVKRNRGVYKGVFSVLSRLLLSNNVGTQGNSMKEWLENLVQPANHLKDSDLLPAETVDLLIKAAPFLGLPSAFHDNYHCLLSKAVEVGGDYEWSIVNLIYWVDCWNVALLNLLQRILESKGDNSALSSHLVNLIRHRCEKRPEGELANCVKKHPFWNRICLLAFSN